MTLADIRDERIAIAARRQQELKNARRGRTEARNKRLDLRDKVAATQDKHDAEQEELQTARQTKAHYENATARIAEVEQDRGRPLSRRQRAKLEADYEERVKRAQRTINKIVNPPNTGAKLLGLQNEYTTADQDYQRKHAAYLEALRVSNLVSEEAADAESVVTRIRRWIAWDGVHAEDGDCNQHYPPTRVSKRTTARRADPTKLRQSSLCRLPSNRRTQLSAQLKSPRISVRITDCSQDFAPINGRALFRITINRPYLVKKLLFRINDANDDTVYQEVLAANEIDQLPLSEARASEHHETMKQRIERCERYAGAAGTARYTAEVWISTEDDDFEDLDLDEEPIARRGIRVSDQTARRTGRQVTSGHGVNQTDAKPARIVSLCLPNVRTDHLGAASKRHKRPIDDKIDELSDSIEAANEAFGELLPGEVRLLVLPEWNFQLPDYPHLYTEADKDEIVAGIEQCSGENQAERWVLIPGSILWGSERRNKMVACFNTAVVASGGNIVHTYHKHAYGQDIKPTQAHYDHCELDAPAEEGYSRRTQLNRKRVPLPLSQSMGDKGWTLGRKPKVRVVQKDRRWIIDGIASYLVKKPNRNTMVVRPRHCFAMVLPTAKWGRLPGLQRVNFDTDSCFETAGIKFGLDTCADHKTGVCAANYTTLHTPGRGAGIDEGLDVYVIIAAQVQIAPEKVLARTNGYLVKSDGELGMVVQRVTARTRNLQAYGTHRKHVIDQRLDLPVAAVAPAVPPGTVDLEDIPHDSARTAEDVPLKLYRFALVDP